MTVLVDAAVWPWRGDRWAHLVSDVDHDELHRFAHRLGVPYVAFQGDHYDVPSALRARALELGAEPVDARVLVRRLRAAGLRDRRARRPWAWAVRERAVGPADVADAVAAAALAVGCGDEVVAPLLAAAVELADDGSSRPPPLTLSAATRPGEVTVALWAPVGEVAGPPLERDGRVALHRTAGERGTFVEAVVDG